MFERLKSPVDLEEEVLEFWEKERIFERSIEQAKDRPPFVFFEGPPTANGTPHNGHVLTRVIKDVYPRYRTMRGYRVDRRAGWDTHGLPVEVEVEKALDIHGKEAIEAYGLEQFSRKCIDSVFTYIGEWERLTKQIGFWVDLDDAYVTFHRHYVESVWWALARLFEKGLLYQGHKVVWWWPQGGTTLSAGEVGMGYKTVDDPAVTVRFRDAEDASVSYLAWTTTPWTLPSNVALAVGADITYAYCADPEGGTVVLAEALAEAFGLEVQRTVKGSELVGKRYTPLYAFEGEPAAPGEQYVIVTGGHVTTSAGTGIVHTAPAFGEDDMLVAKEHGLAILQWIDPAGRFTPNAGEFAGMFCKEADVHVIRDLKERGLMFKRDTVRHEYPFCWRADSDPLIQYARPAWFIRTTAKNAEALENNQAVSWLPEHIQEGRFGDFLRNNVDWALSRERFWGTPLPIWECPECEARWAAESTEAILAKNPDAFSDDVDIHLQVHKPWIDGVTVPCDCGAQMNRVSEVIDCWFDSGCMPFAQWGFPHKNREEFAQAFPADFISEAVDQTRGWFYSLLMISTLVFDDETCQEYGLDPVGMPRPYKNCIVLGHVCDIDGRKESKSKGNYTSPDLVLRGFTHQVALPDPQLKPGQVGLKSEQVKSLDLAKHELIRLAAEGESDEVSCRVVAADVDPRVKDTVHMHPDDLAAIGLPPEGGRVRFTMPIDPPGADAFRWLFCASTPPWSNTRLSLRAIRDGQREFLMRLRNVVQFFSIYANIAAEQGTFDPKAGAPRSLDQRSELDRWIGGRVSATVKSVESYMDDYRLYEAAREISALVDGLSNWYVRRSRARFWGEGDDSQDALWTLYEVLRSVTRLIGPFVPFTAEAMWGVLERAPFGDAVEPSVHLASWPEAGEVDEQLDAHMDLVREIASLGLSARAATGIKVRQPLAAVTVVLADPSQQAAVERLASLITDELNVREVRFATEAQEFVDFAVKPNFKALGPKLGKGVKEVAKALSGRDGAEIKRALDGGGLELEIAGNRVTITSAECDVRVSAKADYEAASSARAVVVLHTQLDDDLRAEGFVRELTNRVQNLRKEMDLGYTQRIALQLDGDDVVRQALASFGDALARETLAKTWQIGEPEGDGERREWDVEGRVVTAGVQAL
ncbi:MAG: isoleucine--tRNA ligase [Deltaproteobacteria bacterium]|nr:MAG: isoleucine--tRNA ligase [Deltaproteobacteria bacterium]